MISRVARCVAKHAWQMLLLGVAVLLVLRPEAHVMMPLLDFIGAAGMDTLCLLIEFQVLAWGLTLYRRGAGPWITAAWNRVATPRWSVRPDQDLLAQGVLSGLHRLLCKGGYVGLLIYLAYLACCQHVDQLQLPLG